MKETIVSSSPDSHVHSSSVYDNDLVFVFIFQACVVHFSHLVAHANSLSWSKMTRLISFLQLLMVLMRFVLCYVENITFWCGLEIAKRLIDLIC